MFLPLHLCLVNPVLSGPCDDRPYCHYGDVMKGHLFYQATFHWQKGWPDRTGLTNSVFMLQGFWGNYISSGLIWNESIFIEINSQLLLWLSETDRQALITSSLNIWDRKATQLFLWVSESEASSLHHSDIWPSLTCTMVKSISFIASHCHKTCIWFLYQLLQTLEARWSISTTWHV